MFNWRDFDPATLRGKANTLISELVTYRDRLDEILAHEGEYVLIKGDQIMGYFPSPGEALAMAVKKFGRVPCLIKRVVEFERPIRVGNVL